MVQFNYSFEFWRTLFWENSSTMSASCEMQLFPPQKRKKIYKGEKEHLQTMFGTTNTLFIAPKMLNEYLQLLQKIAWYIS